MSADNGYTVAEVNDRPGQYGIFYWMGDADYACVYERAVVVTPAPWPYTKRHVYDSVEEAIMNAHRLNVKEPTEYGVTVEPRLLTGGRVALVRQFIINVQTDDYFGTSPEQDESISEAMQAAEDAANEVLADGLKAKVIDASS
jgi:hypothetical protein